MLENPKPLAPANEAATAPLNGLLPFVTRILPWLLGVLMLGVYGVTLNHWISPESIGLVAGLEGITWTPRLSAPVTFLVTWPFGWLPGAWIPLAVNLFTAVCAAVSLAFLARSVALLPHDLSKDAPPERWGFVPPKLMSSRDAWVPPVFAVLACGLQLSFWQNAITATGQVITLLMFAYVIRCFLEFNASSKDSWLLRGAVVSGLAVANEPVMAIFMPVFLVGLLWVKRVFSLNQRKLEQMIGRRTLKLHLLWQFPVCWLAGWSLILLLPILAALSTNGHAGFWSALNFGLQAYKTTLTHLPHEFLICACLIGVMPVFLIGLRYYHLLGGASNLHLFLGTALFQLIYGFFLLVNLWTFFDTPLSPRRLAPGINTLPLYFLEALSIGFFIGHFLLTAAAAEPAAQVPSERRRSSSYERQRQQMLRLARSVKWGILTGVFLLAVGIPAALVYKNRADIALARANPSDTCFQQVVQTLPPEGAVLIGRDTFLLACLQTDLIRAGHPSRYLLLNTTALVESTNYWTFLHQQKHPGFNLEVKLPDLSDVNNRKLIPVTLLEELGKAHAIYSLPPAPINEVIAEMFYFQPQGLLYRVNHYPADAAFAPVLPPETVRENETFWQNFRNVPFTNLVRRINPPQRLPASGLLKRFVNTLRFWPEADRDSTIAGVYYAGALNDWGVELQKSGQLQAAGQCFADALELNPRNAPAQINLDFNADYQANREITIQKPLDTVQSMNKYRDWRYVVEQGAVDEPNFCYMLGAIMADNRLFRPAIAQFERVKKLSPANVDTSVSLARLFVECHDITNALAASDDVLALSPTNETGLFFKSNSQIQMGNYKEAIPLLNEILAQNPTNYLARLNRGIALRCSYLFDAARRDYQAVVQANDKTFPAYYDLAQMDDTENKVASAIANYELFLKYAPPNVQEVAIAQARLKALKPAATPSHAPAREPGR